MVKVTTGFCAIIDFLSLIENCDKLLYYSIRKKPEGKE